MAEKMFPVGMRAFALGRTALLTLEQRGWTAKSMHLKLQALTFADPIVMVGCLGLLQVTILASPMVMRTRRTFGHD
jgi:hypothetical protein